MSNHDAPPYSQLAINAWTSLCAIVAAVIFLAFVFNGPITDTFHWIWDLLRYLARPII